MEAASPDYSWSGVKGVAIVHCVLWERRPKTAVVWYRDGEVQGVEEFVEAADAEDWAGELLTAFHAL